MIQSEDFETRKKGFSLKSDGSFEAKDGVFRGAIEANDAEFTGRLDANVSLFGGDPLPMLGAVRGYVDFQRNINGLTIFSKSNNINSVNTYEEGVFIINFNADTALSRCVVVSNALDFWSSNLITTSSLVLNRYAEMSHEESITIKVSTTVRSQVVIGLQYGGLTGPTPIFGEVNDLVPTYGQYWIRIRALFIA